VSVPGFKPEDVELTIEGDQLTVRGHTKEEKEVKKEDYLMNERRTSSFVRRVSLPKGLDTDKAEASYDDGVLTVTFPKSKDATAKSIKVKVKAKNGAKT
jgi:HSP20 family protein